MCNSIRQIFLFLIGFEFMQHESCSILIEQSEIKNLNKFYTFQHINMSEDIIR